jgi:integral membrane protein (TIGR01906 family)
VNPASAVGARLFGPLIAAAAAILILGVSILPFLTPAWVAFDQDRAQAAAWTGYSEPDLRAVSNSILGDLVLGQGDFDVQLDGAPVLTPAERAHMRDVRGVFGGLALLASLSAVLVVVAFRRTRAPEARTRTWLGIRRGAITLAGVVVVLGVVAAVAFDPAFELFHRLFFAPGTYDFDPRTSRLVQLFPETFWSETAIAVGVLIVVLAVALAWFAAGRAERARALDAMVARLTRPAADVAQPGPAAEVAPGPLTPRGGPADQSVTNGAQR